jgi:hypothetical protein
MPASPPPPPDLLARCLDTIPERARTVPLSGRPVPDRASLLRFGAIAAASALTFSLWFTAPGMRGRGFGAAAVGRSGAGELLTVAERATTQADYVRVEGRALAPVRPTRPEERLRFAGPWRGNRFVFDRGLGSYGEVDWTGGVERRLQLRDGRSFWRRNDTWSDTSAQKHGADVVNPALTTVGADPRRSLGALFPDRRVRSVTRSVTLWKGRPAERFAFAASVTGPFGAPSREGIALFVAPGSRRLMAIQRFIVRGDSWDEKFAEFEVFYDRRPGDAALFDPARFTAGGRQVARPTYVR